MIYRQNARQNQRQFQSIAICLAVFEILLLAGCSRPSEQPKTAEEKAPATTVQPAEPPKPQPSEPPSPAPSKEPSLSPGHAPATFKVRFDTSKGPFVIEVHRDWAPLGADHFYALVKSGYFDGARFFRVVPNFVVQFGLAANPATTRKWNTPIADDPVTQTNRLGSIVYATAGPNTRTTQLFINLRSNQSLDSQGFAPFGMVLGDGMSVVEQIYKGYGEQPDQGAITERGNEYINSSFPKLDFIKKAVIEG
jgi:peptidyl-prolyl cis-trans isomerase A (cyclophilin A)